MKPQPIRPMAGNGVYGERKSINDMQASAQMAGDPIPAMEPVTPMFAPTTNPTEPVTAGSVLGAGAGPEALNIPNVTPSLTSTLKRLAQTDPTGEAEYALMMLNNRGIS